MRIVRKSDGDFVEFGHDNELAFRLLWERAARGWVQDWIDFHEEGVRYSGGAAYWQRPEVVAG